MTCFQVRSEIAVFSVTANFNHQGCIQQSVTKIYNHWEVVPRSLSGVGRVILRKVGAGGSKWTRLGKYWRGIIFGVLVLGASKADFWGFAGNLEDLAGHLGEWG